MFVPPAVTSDCRSLDRSPETLIPVQTPLHQAFARIADQTTGYSSMRAAGPAAWPAHPFFELRAHPFDMLPPCLIFFDGDGPADPLVARERRYVFPCSPCLRVGRERLLEISREIMYDPSGDSRHCHRVISPGVCARLLRPKSGG